MSERPFMQLYVSDFIGDTLSLSTEQIGAYMLLLMAMWNAGGKLPADEAKLARVTRMSVKKWKAVADDLMHFFEVDGDTITHNRLTKELQKSESKSQSRAAAGAAGGNAKALKDKEAYVANAKRSPQHLPDTITREESSSLRSEETRAPKPDFESEFEKDLWPIYPRKAGKGQALKAYCAARKQTSREIIVAGAERYALERAGQDHSFTKHPATWLNGQCWLDEPTPPRGHSPPSAPKLTHHQQRHQDALAAADKFLGINSHEPEFTGNTFDLEPGDFRSHG